MGPQGNFVCILQVVPSRLISNVWKNNSKAIREKLSVWNQGFSPLTPFFGETLNDWFRLRVFCSENGLQWTSLDIKLWPSCVLLVMRTTQRSQIVLKDILYTLLCKDFFSKYSGENRYPYIKQLQLWKTVVACAGDNCIFCCFVYSVRGPLN